MKSERFFTSRVGIIVSATITCILWGSAFPFIKISYGLLHIGENNTFEQILFAGYRFFIASNMLMLLLFFKKRSVRYIKGSFPALLQVGFFQTTLQYSMFYIGLSYSTGIQGSIITGSTTFFSILLAHFMYRNDRISWRKIVGIILGIMGVLLASSTTGKFSFSFGIGEIGLLIAAFSNSLGGILAKNKAKELDTIYLTSFQMFLGSIVLLILGASGAGFIPFHFNMQAIGYLLYLAFLSAAGFSIWNTVLKYNKVGKVSMYLFLIPAFGVLQSTIFLKEALHPTVFISLLLVVSGIIIVNLEKKPNPTFVAASNLPTISDKID